MSKIPGFRSGKLWKKAVATIGYLFIILIVYGMIKGGGSSATTSSSGTPSSQAPSVSTAAPSTSKPTATPAPAPAAPTPAVKTYKAGMYKIGSDMPEGEYVLIGNGMSYFEIDKDSTGTMNSILANDNFSKRSIISAKSGQYVKLTNCTAYAFKDAPKVEPQDGYLLDGMYKVGVDLPAGEYKIIPTGSIAYKEISSDSSHDMGSIIANDILQGESYATVKNGQYLKLTGSKLKLN